MQVHVCMYYLLKRYGCEVLAQPTESEVTAKLMSGGSVLLIYVLLRNRLRMHCEVVYGYRDLTS